MIAYLSPLFSSFSCLPIFPCVSTDLVSLLLPLPFLFPFIFFFCFTCFLCHHKLLSFCLNVLFRLKGSRIEDQRSEMPIGRSAPTVPDEDFINLILRFQSSRLDEQRSAMPEGVSKRVVPRKSSFRRKTDKPDKQSRWWKNFDRKSSSSGVLWFLVARLQCC